MTLLVAASFADREVVGRACADLIMSGFNPDDIEVLARGGRPQSQLVRTGGHLTATEGTLLGVTTGILVAGAWLLILGGGQLTGLAATWAGWVVIVTGGMAGAVAGGIAGALYDVIANERSRSLPAKAHPDPEWLLAVHADDQHWAAAEFVLMAYSCRVYDTRGFREQ